MKGKAYFELTTHMFVAVGTHSVAAMAGEGVCPILRCMGFKKASSRPYWQHLVNTYLSSFCQCKSRP